MKEALITAAIIFVVAALVRTLGTAITGSEPPLVNVIVEAFACALLLTPLLAWIRPATPVAPAPAMDDDTSTVDPISNTLNTRGLTINLLEAMALSERYNRELAIVMMAMDDTDDVHGRYGDAGVESALEMIGDTLVQTLRVPDRAGRYQNDVFLLILPETDSSGGTRIAERIRRQVVDIPVKVRRGEAFSITSSAGVAEFQPGDDPQALISRAESALSDARQMGQNRTVAWSA